MVYSCLATSKIVERFRNGLAGEGRGLNIGRFGGERFGRELKDKRIRSISGELRDTLTDVLLKRERERERNRFKYWIGLL
jgi:hypothetical protein